MKKSVFDTLLLSIVAFFMPFLLVNATNHKPLFSSDSPQFFEKIQKEFTLLQNKGIKSSLNPHATSLSDATNAELAPTLNIFLTQIVERLIKKTTLKMPAILIYVQDDQTSYNASMQKIRYTSLLTSTTQSGQSMRTEIVNDEYNLTIGKDVINLFLWNNHNKNCLAAVIAHEIGHAVNNHTTQSIENEFQADRTAVKLLQNPSSLAKGITMLTLAGHIYNTLAAIASPAFIPHVHFFVRTLSSALVQEYPDLGQLGSSSSHSAFAQTVRTALDPIVNIPATDQKAIDPTAIIMKAYENLRLACSNPQKLMGMDKKELSAQGKMLDELTDKMFSPIHHPAPKKRMSNIFKAIAEKKDS